MRYSKTKTRTMAAAAVAGVLVLSASACSSGDSDVGESGTDTTASSVVVGSVATTATAVPPSTTSTTTGAPAEGVVSVEVRFAAGNGEGSVTVSGVSPVAAWFGDWPGEILDLPDADAGDAASVVEGFVSFWFFRDENRGAVPPTLFVPAGGDITDSLGTRYAVEAQPLPAAPVASTTTAPASVSSVPGTSEPPATTTSSSATTTTTTAAEPPEVLQVQVLNASGVAGAAGAITARLSEAGFVVLPPGNSPRYSSSAVYYAQGWQESAEEILQASGIEQIDAPAPMPEQFATSGAAVVILLGADTAPPTGEQADLRPRQRNTVQLPLPDDTPRDRYVPGLAAINIYSQINDQGSLDVQAKLEELSIYLRYIGNYQPFIGATAANRDTQGTFREAAKLLEDTFAWLGFTPQNVCGAPQGYSFTDLLQPTREWSEELKVYAGDAIFTTDRLIELHGGERINPEENLGYYIREAVQTAHDALRLHELLDETETPQMILCRAWKMPEGEIPEGANAYWYALLNPGIQPRESLLSQGAYHIKEISRNGNFAYLIVCHPTIGERYVRLWWREGGYRAEVTGELQNNGCQATYEIETYREDTYGTEDIFVYGFGERVFSASDLQAFPRAGG